MEFMGDFVISFLLRAGATVVGGVLGLITWYIGDGSGHGNPYGFMAACAVMITIVMYVRIFAPLQYLQATIMGGATFVLVVGYSWEE